MKPRWPNHSNVVESDQFVMSYGLADLYWAPDTKRWLIIIEHGAGKYQLFPRREDVVAYLRGYELHETADVMAAAMAMLGEKNA